MRSEFCSWSRCTFALLLLAAAPAFAQSIDGKPRLWSGEDTPRFDRSAGSLAEPAGSPLRVPMLGFVPAPGGGLRLLVGIPGAAQVAGYWDLKASAMAFLQNSHRVIAIRRDGAAMLAGLFGPDGETLLDAPPGATDVLASPSGTRVVLRYAPDRVLLLKWADQTFGTAGWLNLPLDGSLLALSDDGVLLVDSGGQVAAFSAERAPWPVGTLGEPVRATFFRHSPDAVLAGQASGTVWIVKGAGAGSPSLEVLLRPVDGAPVGSGVAVSPDNARIYVAGRNPDTGAGNAGLLAMVDKESRSLRFEPVAVPLTGLVPLNSASVFLATEQSAAIAPLWMLEDGASPRLYFIPAPQSHQEAAQ